MTCMIQETKEKIFGNERTGDSFNRKHENIESTQMRMRTVVTHGTVTMMIIICVTVINPLNPSIKLQILLLCFHTFLTEVVGRSC